MRRLLVAAFAAAAVAAVVYLYARYQSRYGIDTSLASEYRVEDDSPGVLGLRVYPSGGEVRIDGRLVGLAGAGKEIPVRADAGLHELLVQRVGFHDHRSIVRFASGMDRHAAVHLVPHRNHAAQIPAIAPLRRGDVLRGSLEQGDLRVEEIYAVLGPETERRTEGGLGDRVELLGLESGRAVSIDVISIYRMVWARVFDDRGREIARPPELSWSYDLDFTPEEGRRYFVLVEHQEVEKFATMGLVRYALQLNQR